MASKAPAKQAVINDTKQDSTQKRENKFKAWKLPPRYEIVQPLGQGAYGQVCQAQDREKDVPVAIKQAKRLFEDLIDAKRILREVAILGRLDHPNICKLHDMVVPADLVKFDEVYMVLEFCESDLKKLCRAQVHLEHMHVTTLLYHLVVGLNYLHSAGIWHRDLKPANCLVNEDCTVKICDYGLARALGGSASSSFAMPEEKSKRVLTGHVVTRWYRAPELILLQENYTEAIDVWSVGCIYAELLGMLKGTPFDKRAPLFPGHTCFPLSPHEQHKTDTKYYTKGDKDQLSKICALIGSPSDADIDQLQGDDARAYMRCFAGRTGSGLRAKYAPLDEVGSDLLEKMLVFNAGQRISVAEALRHPLFSKVRSRSRETTAECGIDLDFEQEPKIDERSLRKYFLREIRQYHPEVPEI